MWSVHNLWNEIVDNTMQLKFPTVASYPQNRNTFQIVIVAYNVIITCWAAETHASLPLFRIQMWKAQSHPALYDNISISKIHIGQKREDRGGEAWISAGFGEMINIWSTVISIWLQNNINIVLKQIDCRALSHSSRTPGCTNRWLDFWFSWNISGMSGVFNCTCNHVSKM